MNPAGRSSIEIAYSIEVAIRGGDLTAGAPLPPIRELAARLAVSPVTVASAYRALSSRGLTVADGRRGTRVRDISLTVSAGWRLDGVRDLASDAPDPALLPDAEGWLARSPGLQHRHDTRRDLAELQSFVRAELDADGVAGSTPIMASGGMDAIDRVLRERVRPGDRVAVEDPGFPALFDLLAASGLHREPVELDQSGPRPDSFAAALRRRARAVIVTASAQNPTGALITRERAAALRELLRRHRDMLVIEVDPAGPLCSDRGGTLCDGSHPVWAAIRPFASFLGPDLRMAALVGDELTMARVRARQMLGPGPVSHILQRLAVGLWSDPAGGRALARAAGAYEIRRMALLDALRDRGIAAAASSGFNVWVPVADEGATVQALVTRGWAVAPGQRFRIRSAPGIRITTSALEPDASRRFAADLAWAMRPETPLA
jgi:DNA-binding transcriptional MocR family regulator